MVMFYSCRSNSQKLDNTIDNELWTWDNFTTVGGIGSSEALYLSADGYFQYIRSYSGGAHWVHWYTGNFQFSKDSCQLIFMPVNSNLKMNDTLIDTRDCLDTINVLSKTDTSVIINRKPIDKREHDAMSTTFKRQQNPDILAIPEGQITEPKSVSIQKYGSDDKIEIPEGEQKAVLSIINSAVFDKELNDGRMMKMLPQEYDILVEYDNNYDFKISVWKSKIRIQGKWYIAELDKLNNILSKYII